MKDNISDWYSLISIEPTAETIQQRVPIIETISEQITLDEISDAIKIFYDYEVQDSVLVKKFFAEIKEIDSTFTLTRNKLEFRMLMGALIYFIVYNSSLGREIKVYASLGMLSIHFNNEKYKPLISVIVEYVREYLSSESVESRELTAINFKEDGKFKLDFKENAGSDWPIVASQFDQLKTVINQLQRKINKQGKTFEDNLKSQKEETNILWWLMGEYSYDLDRKLSDCSKSEAGLIIANELANQTLVIPGPINIKSFIIRALSLSKGENKDSISGIINTTNKEWRVNLIDSIGSNLVTVLTPITLAINESIQTDVPNDWFSFFKKKTDIPVTNEVNIDNVAIHFYNELILLKLLKNING